MSVHPPIAMRAPEAAYTVFYVVFALGAAGGVGWLGWRAWRLRSALPLGALCGGLVVGVVMPPVNDSLTCVWFPSNIPLPYVTAFGMRDPLFDLIGTALFFGLGGWTLCEMLLAGRGSAAVWLTFTAWAGADLLLELPFLHWGMYRYYGPQPLLVGGCPVYWVFMNGAVPVLAGVLLFCAVARWPFDAEGAAWPVLWAPVIAAAFLLIPMGPVAVALHADVAGWLRVAAALLSIGVSVAGVRFVAGRFARAAADSERVLGTPWPA